jgi:hypothetical protein
LEFCHNQGKKEEDVPTAHLVFAIRSVVLNP